MRRIFVALGRVGYVVDDRLIATATATAHGVQRAIGWTSYRQARELAILCALVHGWGTAVDWLGWVTGTKESLALRVTGLIGTTWVLIFFAGQIRVLTHLDRLWTQADVLPAVFAFERVLHTHVVIRAIRLLSVGLTILGLALVALAGTWEPKDFSTGIATVFLYWRAVEPLPPGASRLREWLSRWTTSRRLVPAQIPVR